MCHSIEVISNIVSSWDVFYLFSVTSMVPNYHHISPFQHHFNSVKRNEPGHHTHSLEVLCIPALSEFPTSVLLFVGGWNVSNVAQPFGNST